MLAIFRELINVTHQQAEQAINMALLLAGHLRNCQHKLTFPIESCPFALAQANCPKQVSTLAGPETTRRAQQVVLSRGARGVAIAPDRHDHWPAAECNQLTTYDLRLETRDSQLLLLGLMLASVPVWQNLMSFLESAGALGSHSIHFTFPARLKKLLRKRGLKLPCGTWPSISFQSVRQLARGTSKKTPAVATGPQTPVSQRRSIKHTSSRRRPDSRKMRRPGRLLDTASRLTNWQAGVICPPPNAPRLGLLANARQTGICVLNDGAHERACCVVGVVALLVANLSPISATSCRTSASETLAPLLPPRLICLARRLASSPFHPIER